MPETPTGRGDLQRAARIGGGNHIRRERRQVAGFAITQIGGGPRLHQVVDAGAPAADLGLGRRDDLHARNGLEQRARFGTHALAVRQVAGVVIGDTGLERMPRRTLRPEFRQEL